MSYAGARYQGNPQLGVVDPLSVINVATGLPGVLTGIFSSDGPNAEKYKERGKFISSLVGMAQAGDIRAWHALGAYGWPKIKTPVELPAPYSRPPKYGGDGKTKPVGYALAGNEWGDAYKPLRESAHDAYQKLAYKFTAGATPPVGGGPIVIPPPPPITTGWPVTDTQDDGSTPVYQPLPGYTPAPVGPTAPVVQQAGVLGFSPLAIGGAIGLGLLVLATQQPRRNPLRRRGRRR